MTLSARRGVLDDSGVIAQHDAPGVVAGCKVVSLQVTTTPMRRAGAQRSSTLPGGPSPTTRRVELLVAAGETIICEACGHDHQVFDLDGSPRLQAIRCDNRTIPVGMENRRFPPQSPRPARSSEHELMQ
jgi:hypothetical protein